ncbi:MAG TPA: hypothetical protein RMH99_16900 [Sandaracinaceae bacterium LLY-WYZ-13_1]|nr:hypothetical protein [Sandaracinaceae bacterium LLY-WYZ-13_1]
MVEIEWDGLELSARDRQVLFDRIRWLTRRLTDQARIAVEIVREGGQLGVRIDARDADHGRIGVEVRHAHFPTALQRASDLVAARWGRTHAA